jgi:hypothetical protein
MDRVEVITILVRIAWEDTVQDTEEEHMVVRPLEAVLWVGRVEEPNQTTWLMV